MLDKDGSNISLSDEDKQSVYVFNEDFIEQNIRIEQDGLNAIVVIGAITRSLQVEQTLKEQKLSVVQSTLLWTERKWMIRTHM